MVSKKQQKRKKPPTIAKKWLALIGCKALFNQNGILDIYQDFKAIRLTGNTDERWFTIGGTDGFGIMVMHRLGDVSYVPREYCKIIKSKKVKN